MDHFGKSKMQQLGGEFQSKTGQDLIDQLNRDSKRKDAERTKRKQ